MGYPHVVGEAVMRKKGLILFALLGLLFSIASGSYREEFEKGFLTKTWSGEQPEANFCIECHSSEKMKPAFLTIAEEWKASWHALHRIACHDCHGGDPKDPSMSMSPHRGFVGTPKYDEVPEFCGKCHIGILKHYLESDHGKALRTSGKGPNCVTCHGSHNIQKANIEIISEQRCGKCHSYERAKTMKQALFLTEKKIDELEADLLRLKREGVFVDDDAKNLFSTQAEFRALFHSVDVNLVKDRTNEFSNKLAAEERKIQDTFKELRFRRNFSAFILLIFAGMGTTLYLIIKTPKQ
jgi:nitrate/TMAO reductase-like tetraheme cytochrome c subunit